MTRIAIVGSRNYPHLDSVRGYVNRLPLDSIVISGGAQGVDRIAANAASARGMKTIVHEPEWNKYGKSAGMIRNSAIIDDCEKLVAFWDGESRGTADSIEKAKKAGKFTIIYYADDKTVAMQLPLFE